MITRKGLADEIDAIDASIKDLNGSKSDAYQAYREQLEGTGMEPRRAVAELAAVKAAIVKRRKLAADPEAVAEKDDLIDAILTEIQSRPSRAREAGQDYQEWFLPTIPNPSAPPPPETTDTTEALTPQASVAHSPETANEMDHADEGSFETGIVAAGNRLEANPAGPVAGEVSHAGAGESPATIPEPFEPPAFLQKDRAPLRPHCLHPDNLELCAGSGRTHCHACLKARDEAMVPA